jgi:hypothetical protein
MVGAGFIEDDNALLRAKRADDKKRLDEGSHHGKCRDEEPNAGSPTVIGEQTKHRRSGLGSFYFRGKRNRSFV